MIQKNNLTNTEKVDWKPRNKQTAIVISRASWIHKSPEQSATEIKTREQRHAEWLKGVREDIERKEYEGLARLERRRILKETRALNKKPKEMKVRRMRCNWVRKALKKKHRLTGLPDPTNEQILAEKKKQANYGKPMFSISKEHRERQLGMLTEEARHFYQDALAEMDCFGDPFQSQHEKALEKAMKFQQSKKSQ